MSKIVYPRPCPTCGVKINNRGNFSRHRKHCGTNTRVPCLHCDKTFCRKDKMTAHVRKCHSETAEPSSKRKTEETTEPSGLELSKASKVPRKSDVDQTGGTVSTRGTKREATQEQRLETKMTKQDDSDSSDEEEEETSNSNQKKFNQLFVANIKKLGPAKRWKKDVVINQKFIMTLDQQRPPSPLEDLNIEATFAIATALENLIQELKILDDFWMTLQIGSKEHQKEGLTGETWKISVKDFVKQAEMAQSLLNKIALVLNSAEFITRDVGFSASVLFSRPERKGGKTAGGGPGQEIWSQMCKQSRSVCEIKKQR